MSDQGHGKIKFFKNSPEERTRNISVLLVAGVSAVVHGCLGVALAPLFSITFLGAGFSASAWPGASPFWGEGSGALFIILFPVAYGMAGFAVGAAAACLYNSLAKHLFSRHYAEEAPKTMEATAMVRSA